MKIKKKEKRVLGAIFLAGWGTGAALFAFTRFVRVSSAVGEQHAPAESWVRTAHTATTYVLAVALGFLIQAHVIPGLRGKKRIQSGIGMLTVFGVLIATAIAILYVGDSPWSGPVAQIHDWVGLGCLGLLLFHSRKKVT